jgi:hypothetical protein
MSPAARELSWWWVSVYRLRGSFSELTAHALLDPPNLTMLRPTPAALNPSNVATENGLPPFWWPEMSMVSGPTLLGAQAPGPASAPGLGRPHRLRSVRRCCPPRHAVG